MALPDRPSLEYLKKLAKDRLHDLRRADPRARLADAQRAVAREHGFASWRALRAELDRRRRRRAEPVVELFAAIRARGGGRRGPPAHRASRRSPTRATRRAAPR